MLISKANMDSMIGAENAERLHKFCFSKVNKSKMLRVDGRGIEIKHFDTEDIKDVLMRDIKNYNKYQTPKFIKTVEFRNEMLGWIHEIEKGLA